jgi:two-component system response regulator MprA
MRLLVVEDNADLAELLTQALARHGFAADVMATAGDAEEAVSSAHYAAMILDLGLPDEDGLLLLKRLRKQGVQMPVLALTARGSVADRVEGLQAGADDYLTKPFALEELLARLRALLRRSLTGEHDESDEKLTFADLSMDIATREVRRGTRSIELTRTEFSLLELFLRRPRRVLDRSFILEEVWGFDFPTTANSLEVYVGYVRRKRVAEGEPRLLHTVRGVGYVLRDQPA